MTVLSHHSSPDESERSGPVAEPSHIHVPRPSRLNHGLAIDPTHSPAEDSFGTYAARCADN
ncbi:MAG: hypothetical protein M3336_03130 [Chloroflexota bacterium]|nr:hypothetical protein [Chloroflexota bacterium]